MALVYDTELTPALIEELENLIDGCSNEALLELGRQIESLLRGFQAKPDNVKIIRQRLKKALHKNGEIADKIKEFIAANSLNRQFVCVLSHEALKYCLTELLSILGVEPLLLGLLFDRREAVRRLGRDCLKHPVKLYDDIPRARQELSRKLEEFTAIFLFVSDKNVSAPQTLKPNQTAAKGSASDHNGEIKRLKQQLEEYKCNRREVNVLNKKLAALTEKYQQQLAECEKLKSSQKNIRRENARLQEALTEAKEQLEHLQQNQEKLIRAGVANELETLSHSWLKQPIAVENYCNAKRDAAGEDIFAQVEAVLERQVEQDRHYGNIKELNDRLARLQKSKQQLEQAKSNSIKPLPELQAVCHQVESEIEELQQLLRMQKSDNQLNNVCLQQLNQADSPEKIIAVEEMLQLFSRMKLLSTDELKQL